MVKIGEDRVERVDYRPAKIAVKVYVTPKYACPNKNGVQEAVLLSTSRNETYPSKSTRQVVRFVFVGSPVNRVDIGMGEQSSPARLHRCLDEAGGERCSQFRAQRGCGTA
jgi:transposase